MDFFLRSRETNKVRISLFLMNFKTMCFLSCIKRRFQREEIKILWVLWDITSQFIDKIDIISTTSIRSFLHRSQISSFSTNKCFVIPLASFKKKNIVIIFFTSWRSILWWDRSKKITTLIKINNYFNLNWDGHCFHTQTYK